jgi:hypothetical protein
MAATTPPHEVVDAETDELASALRVGIGLLCRRSTRRRRWAAVGAASVAYMTATTAIAQLRTDQQMLGRVLAIETVLLIGTTPIGGPILGALADTAGARAPVLVGGVAALTAAALGHAAARRFAIARP